MRRHACVLLVLLLASAVAYAELVSDDFLEYLGSLEGDDENWTDFAEPVAAASTSAATSGKGATQAAVQAAVKAASSSSSASSVMSKAVVPAKVEP